jgi:hypothetical protein
MRFAIAMEKLDVELLTGMLTNGRFSVLAIEIAP